jgi:hypothetical protein
VSSLFFSRELTESIIVDCFFHPRYALLGFGATAGSAAMTSPYGVTTGSWKY